MNGSLSVHRAFHRLVAATTVCAALLTFVSCAAALQDRAVVPLWPGKAPGSEQVTIVEEVVQRSRDPKVPDRFVHRITRPTLTVFVPKRPVGTSLLIVPGGSYIREVFDKEGFEIATWFAARGVTAFVLKHRLPAEGHVRGSDVPLQDAQRALRLIRSKGAEWKLDPQRIGVFGASAGGHVAASLSTRFDATVYAPVDAIDRLSARPDFSLLLYPVISMQPLIAHAGSRQALLGTNPSSGQVARHSLELHVTAATPPTIIILADDERSVPPAHGLGYYQALHRMGVSAELHIYAAGGHGFALRSASTAPVARWPYTAWAWLSGRGMVSPGRSGTP